MAYFPELQVIWGAELSEKSQKEMMSVDTAPLDRISRKFGKMEQLEKLQDKWLARRENSIMFKSMVGAIRGHSVPTKPSKAAADVTDAGKGKAPARFSALWPEVMDVVAD